MENALEINRKIKQIMDGKLSLKEGMLYENVINQMITATGKNMNVAPDCPKANIHSDISVIYPLH